ncbi:Coupling of ubiquitin conjugation to ER degradation protein 1 [Vanrija pseudolonga]|uniref:Coupling of ubiquitin conjugation to ER degradation protein 1 n=1 Tax=Vanrija pseudolonga TaxID=143232 RepID=A0AAF0Y625_9TREE|nr:Coupling of ubiquitin conjugation to ER degradation protein 1 [Vanrija pseudolonga]
MASEDVLPTLILVAILTQAEDPADVFRGVRREMVESVHAAFPDVPVDAVVYSLTRTRNAQSTSEIILDRGSLPTPPPTFIVPDHLRPAARVPVAPAKAAPPPKPVSLIERYGLASRVSSAADAEPAGGRWEADRAAREAELKSRKERMILDARRRMLEKQKKAEAAPVDPATAE